MRLVLNPTAESDARLSVCGESINTLELGDESSPGLPNTCTGGEVEEVVAPLRLTKRYKKKKQ